MSSIRLSEPTAPRGEPIRVSRARGGGALIALSAVAAVAALVLGAIALISRAEAPTAEGPVQVDEAQRTTIAILARPTTERLEVGGSDGTLILAVARGGNAALVGNRMSRAAEGWAWQAWVYPPGGARPQPAGTFPGGRTAHVLTARVPRGAAVGITLERESGSPQPTSSPAYLVTRPV